MYNEVLKKKFINDYSDSISVRKSCVAVFEVLSKHEEAWGSDLCTKTAKELEPALNDIFGLRIYGRVTRLAILRAYSKWCLENNIEGACDGIMHVNIGDDSAIKEQMVNSPLHLEKYMDSLFNTEPVGTMDDVYRCFLWLAFGGCPEEETVQITINDVDFDNMVVRSDHSGIIREYPIYRESLRAFRNCVELDQFVYFHPNYTKEIVRQRVPGKQLLRGIKTEGQIKLIRVELSKRAREARAAGKTAQRISYYRAWLSGVFYRMHELELVGIEPDFSGVASDFMKGKTYRLSSGRNLIGAKQRRIAKEYKEDYERWKIAFFS